MAGELGRCSRNAGLSLPFALRGLADDTPGSPVALEKTCDSAQRCHNAAAHPSAQYPDQLALSCGLGAAKHIKERT